PGELTIAGRIVSIELQDISQRGLKVSSSLRLQPDEEVVVRLSGLAPRKAHVRWAHGSIVGLNLVRPMSFDELALWVVQQQMPSTSDRAAPVQAAPDQAGTANRHLSARAEVLR